MVAEAESERLVTLTIPQIVTEGVKHVQKKKYICQVIMLPCQLI